MLEALRTAGVEAVLWQTAPLPAHPLFAQPLEVVDAWADGFEKAWRNITARRIQ